MAHRDARVTRRNNIFTIEHALFTLHLIMRQFAFHKGMAGNFALLARINASLQRVFYRFFIFVHEEDLVLYQIA